MKKVTMFICVSLFLFSCNNATKKVEEKEESTTAINCDGIGLVKLADTKATLAEKFAAEDLQEDSKEIKGVKKDITVVFPNKPEEITVVWEDDTRAKIASLIIYNEEGPYATEEGLVLGSSLRDIVKANNYLSVGFTNFYASVDGYADILSFNGGVIEEKYPCLSGRLDIERLKGVDVNRLDAFKLQKEVSSGDAMMQNIDVKLTEISINAK